MNKDQLFSKLIMIEGKLIMLQNEKEELIESVSKYKIGQHILTDCDEFNIDCIDYDFNVEDIVYNLISISEPSYEIILTEEQLDELYKND